MHKIIGIGNALVDVLVRLDDEAVLHDLSLPKGGMELVDDERQRWLASRIQSLSPVLATGGSAGNAVLALANMGAQTGFIGCVGEDDMGRFFQSNCQEHGIEARLIKSPLPSGVANTFITPDAERTFATYLGAAASLSVADVSPVLFEGYQHLHIEGYLVQNVELIEKVCRVAKGMGMTMSIDLASYNVVQANLPLLRNLVENYIDIVFANEEESFAFTEGKNPDAALADIARMADVAVVKVGKRGALAMNGDCKASVPGRSVGVVDTTAAGDFFAGGFLYGYTLGATLEQSLRLGALLSQHIIQVVGTRLSELTWADIRRQAAQILGHTIPTTQPS